ncbi:hypothetical protein B0A52_09129 [Exophiala mesophila]|uniref:ARID domain-containing protein n=1 Tax=Exophiala mesophila TaxID=212818 RepID=A0A438MWM8_EXOME|nr:hypothetical protein B0A52_09129 [Exophiala mesophila]
MPPPLGTILEDEDEFLKDVAAFHEKRGTSFDREGRVSGRPVSLHKLYKLVMDRGGYDALSAERMQWRTLVKEFGFGKAHEAVMTFQLKSVYYKNLAAYEIVTYWGEEPPPREILEDISAKGGDLRSRTLQNFLPPASRDVGNDSTMVESTDQAEHTDEPITPKRERLDSEKQEMEKNGSEEPGSASRYSTRQLRQDPKRTQIFQPDTAPTRARNVRATDSPSTPIVAPSQALHMNGTDDPRNPSFDWFENYKPKDSIPLTLRPHITPGNNPTEFANRKNQARAQAHPAPPPDIHLPLRPFLQHQMSGPNIYLRCLYGLRSGIEEEQKFALHHLVKVSYERGDKYKFEGFPFLAESLLEKALEITELVYGIKFEISYDEVDNNAPINTLNAAFGTHNLLENMRLLAPVINNDGEVESAKFSEKLERLKETALVLRNMVILEENAIFLSKFPLFKDYLVVAVSLPDQPRLAEFRQSVLETAEQVTSYWPLKAEDPLYCALIPHLESTDRGALLSSLRAINRMGIMTPEPHHIRNVPLSSIERLLSLILLESDNDLLEAALTFLYELTATYENNVELLSGGNHLLSSIIPRLVQLLSFQAVSVVEKILAAPVPDKIPIPAQVPTVPAELYQEMLNYREPERSSKWLQCCFEESPSDDITQIQIWQAYQSTFLGNTPLAAADFIKNVSSTFATAQAQVINGPQPRFIIKGIRPRRVLVGFQRQLQYFKCLWEVTRPESAEAVGHHGAKKTCDQWKVSRENLWHHILTDHLKISRTPDGRFDNSGSVPRKCRWTSCSRDETFTKASDIGSHIRVHIPKSPEDMAEVILELANLGKKPERPGTQHAYQYTAMDASQQNSPCGIAWLSVMVLRNLARFANKQGKPFERDGVPLINQLFGGHMYALFNVVGVNRTLREWVGDLVFLIEQGEREHNKGLKREREFDEDD